MHWYIPLEFNIVESVSWLLLLSNTHVERPPIPTGFTFPPLQGDVLLLTPTPVLVIQVENAVELEIQLSKKKLSLTFTAILSKISHDTFTAIRVISSSTACCSVLTGKSTASIHCYNIITRVNIISTVLASS